MTKSKAIEILKNCSSLIGTDKEDDAISMISEAMDAYSDHRNPITPNSDNVAYIALKPSELTDPTINKCFYVLISQIDKFRNEK